MAVTSYIKFLSNTTSGSGASIGSPSDNQQIRRASVYLAECRRLLLASGSQAGDRGICLSLERLARIASRLIVAPPALEEAR